MKQKVLLINDKIGPNNEDEIQRMLDDDWRYIGSVPQILSSTSGYLNSYGPVLLFFEKQTV